ncbi:MAG: hypothetical protein ABSD63_15530 [Candidatus Korobacteraceae bacterium]|jgi:hypothetical protein
MNNTDLHVIAAELNSRSRTHPIGALQEVRADLKGLSRQAGHDIFSGQTITDEWAFHHGGRSELQFNIGEISDPRGLRYGVAFSFETSRTLPSPLEVLAPKVKLFNDFMELNAEAFADMRMWHFEKGGRTPSDEYMPGPIPWERVKEGVFAFLGKRQPLDSIDYEAILGDLDRLLPLYRYVESGGASQPIVMPVEARFAFHAGCSVKASSAVATQIQRQIDIVLRHNELQQALHRRLVSEYGDENVGAENPSGVGTRVDIVVRRENDFWFYEIKTACSPRACLREAVGQLLEYAFWPGGQGATRLVVVGECAIDDDATEYLRRLKDRFSLPIDYEQIAI